MSATHMPLPAAPATGSADTEMPAGVDNTTTSSSVPIQSQKQNLYHSIPLLRGQIRLLQLLPHENEDAAIHCRLFRTALDSGGTRLYEALSYVWGSGDKPRSIFVNGCELAVGGNLYAALLHLRDPFIERTMWIDAICINQEDPEEKGHQVQSMAKIYAKATRIIVWLGEEAAGSDQALEEIRLAADVERYTRRPENYAGILALLQRSWFRRIWVLQEVAAARHILIKCGSAELDGYAFCLGLNALNLFDELRANLRARILSVTYLIRGAIFRPKYGTTCQTDNFSLDIRPLGELIEIYHTREATDRRDKVYALLGMSSDNPIAAGLSADYTISWKQLFNKLIHFFLSESVSVVLSDDKDIAVIEGKGCVLGYVSSVKKNPTWKDRQDVDVTWRKAPTGTHIFSWTLPTTAKSIQEGDVICLLQGASNPTILRPCNYHWTVIMIAVAPAGDLQGSSTSSFSRDTIKWSDLLQSVTLFPHTFHLVWDWDIDPGRQQDQNNHDYSASIPVQEHSETELEGCLDAATRLRIVRLALQDGKLDKPAKKYLWEEIAVLERALRSMNTLKRDCLRPDDSEEEDAKKLETMVNQLTEDEGQWEILRLAAKNGHEMFAKLLLDTDEFSLDSKELHEALCLAAENGYEAIVEMLLDTSQVDTNRHRRDGETALHLAAASGHEAVVKLLLDKYKVNPNLEDDSGRTALHDAADNGNEAVVKLLLASDKVDPNLYEIDGNTALHLAAKRGHEAVIKLLLDSDKVNPNLQDERGRTVLHLAAEEEHEAVVKLLLDSGKVDVNLKNEWGVTALHLAANNGHEAVVKLLLDTGKVDVNPEFQDRWTALITAALNGHARVVELLLESGKVNVNCRTHYGYAALHCAVWNGHDAVVKVLLDSGKVDVNLKDENGRTALHFAAEKGREEVVKLLLDTGKVDLNNLSKGMKTALDLAEDGGHESVVELLSLASKEAGWGDKSTSS